MKHTPGPWKVSPEWPFPDEQGRKHDAVVVEFGNGEQALICSFEHSVMRGSQNANARLIAAAPDMYEVCLQLDNWGKSIPDLNELRKIRKLARIAINKAEGK